MTGEIATRPEAPELTPYEVMERVITSGDLAKMEPEDRLAFYWRTCESLGLNPLTRPFEFLTLGGRIVMYARKDATDQLRQINGVSVVRLEREQVGDLAMVTAIGRDRSGREDSALGAVSIRGLSGEALANAWMKAETKAKRRMTLSLVGLGFLDESEADGGTPVDMDETGALVEEDARPRSLLEIARAQEAALSADDSNPPAPANVPTPGLAPAPLVPPAAAPEPGPVSILAEPMTEEESARFSTVDEETPEPESLAPLVDPEDAEGDAELQKVAAEKALSIQALADLAKDAGVGKRAFSSALDVVPADVGKRIEGMTDEARWKLAESMGLLPAALQ